MNFGLSDEQVLLQKTLRRFHEESCPTTRVRAVMESASGHDPALWAEYANLGVPGLVIPAEHGGSGLELLDLALAAEELGYAAAPGPFLAVAMATVALLESGDDGECRRWLERIASGAAIGTIAFGEEGSSWSPEDVKTEARDGRLRGTKPLVPYASVADFLVVAARDADGPGLWLVERGAPGIEIQPLRVVDQTRRLESLELRDAPGRRLGGFPGLRRSLDAGLVLLAADAYGGSRRCLDMTVGYVMHREQFGQPIGAFQAVKHQLATLACDLEPSLSLVWYAAHAFDRIREESSRQAAMVKAHLGDLFDKVARDTTELHGGIGFTWEYDLQLWFRRSIFDRSFLGESGYHRLRAADLAGW